MIDNDGTPLSKKAETISYSDIYSTPDDKPKVSINKAYAAGSGYVDDPNYKEPPKKVTLLQRMKTSAQSTVDSAKTKFKETVTIENAKKAGAAAGRYGVQIAHNVKNNVEADAREGREEAREAYHNYAPKIVKPLKTPKVFKMKSRRPSQMSEEELTYAIKHGKGKMPEKTPEVFKPETKISKTSRVLKTIARGSKNIIESEGKRLKQTSNIGNMFENKNSGSKSIFISKPKKEKHIKRKKDNNNENMFSMKSKSGGSFKW